MKATILALAVAAGCTTTPSADPAREAAEYKRTDAQLRAADQYQMASEACRARGGVVYVRRSSVSRLPMDHRDMKQATCAASGM